MSDISRENEGDIEKENPLVLYHASSKRDIEEFEPRAESVRDPDEGSVVFATPDKAYVSCFIVSGTDDSWVQKGIFNEDGMERHYIVISDKYRFLRLDKGGAIYSLSPNSFKTDEEKNMGKRELISRNPVKPVSKEEYESGLRAMLENGVEVYFVDKKTFEDIEKAKDHGYEIIKTLDSYKE